MYTVQRRVLVDSKCEFQQSSSHGDGNFAARLVSKTRNDRHTEICLDILRSPIQANAKEGRHSDISECEQLENRLRLFQIRLNTSVGHIKKTLLRRVPVVSLHIKIRNMHISCESYNSFAARSFKSSLSYDQSVLTLLLCCVLLALFACFVLLALASAPVMVLIVRIAQLFDGTLNLRLPTHVKHKKRRHVHISQSVKHSKLVSAANQFLSIQSRA